MPRGAAPGDARRPGRNPATRLSSMATLVLIRHGESVWNSEGLFTGWVDVGLSPKGVDEAVSSGRQLEEAGGRPPDHADRSSRAADPRYAQLPDDVRPRSECLKDVVGRLLPYWYDAIVPDLAAGRTVLVVAHGNSIRALVKHLDRIGDSEIAELDIPTGMPLVYELTDGFRPRTPGGRYLDPQAAAAGAAAVKNQGR